LNPGYNPFRDEGTTLPHYAAKLPTHKNEEGPDQHFDREEIASTWDSNRDNENIEEQIDKEVFFQLHSDFLISPVKSGLMVIHRQRALERIFFEDCLESLRSGKGMSQQHLFPQTVQMSAQDAEILQEIRNDLRLLGFDIEDFGHNTFIIRGTPVELNNTHIKDVLDSIVEQIKRNAGGVSIDKHLTLARSMAVNMAFRHKKNLFPEEVKSLIDRLFATKAPETSPDGKPVVQVIASEEIRQKF
jgi:DNA mismatch repair protein MutL